MNVDQLERELGDRLRDALRQQMPRLEADADDTRGQAHAGLLRPASSERQFAPSNPGAPIEVKPAPAPRDRRIVGWIAAGVAAAGVLAVGGALATRNPSSTDRPAGPRDSTPHSSIARPVVEGGNGTSDTGTTSTDAPITSPDTSPAFTPLVLSEPPNGFELSSAGFDPGPGGIGIAHYVHPDHTTQLQIINRNKPDGEQRMIELDRTPIEVDGRTIYADGPGDGSCVHDACSIGIQWDDDTFISLAWVDVEGGDLVAGSTVQSLLSLIPTLVSDPTVWVPTGPTDR
jgi:hypothetical protein